MRQREHKQGFTFVEVLVIIGILALIAGLSIPFYQSWYVSSQLDNETSLLVQTLRQAQQMAMASAGYSAYGVHVTENTYVLFRGAVYNSGDSFNQTTILPDTISLSSTLGSEIVFERGTGLPSQTGMITLDGDSQKQNSIHLNNLGVIDVE